ncbi:hypothetical protein EJ611_16950, partial [Pseudomonas aeruginosa]
EVVLMPLLRGATGLFYLPRVRTVPLRCDAPGNCGARRGPVPGRRRPVCWRGPPARPSPRCTTCSPPRPPPTSPACWPACARSRRCSTPCPAWCSSSRTSAPATSWSTAPWHAAAA